MEGTNQRKTREHRIDEELKSRLEQFVPDLEGWSKEECKNWLKSEGVEFSAETLQDLRSCVQEHIRERAHEQLLSIEKITTFRLCLSRGGPADYFELDWSSSQSEWSGGRYLFQDWFDGAGRALGEELTAQLAELFCIDPELN